MAKSGQKQAAKRPASSAMVIAGPRGWLMGKVTGQERWDFPKGRLEEGEDPLAAALRETKEECGLDLSGMQGSIAALGRFDYMPDKDLHAFYWYDEEGLADPAACRCESMVELPGREPFPEMCEFEWVDPQQAPLRTGKSLARAIREWIAPQAQRLSARAPVEGGALDRRALLKALCRDPASALEWARSAMDGECPELRQAALELARRPPKQAKRGAGGALWHLRMKLLGMGDAGGVLSMADEGDWPGLAAAFERAGDWIGGPGRQRQLGALALVHERASREPGFLAYLKALPEQDAAAWLAKAFRASEPTALTAALCEYGALDGKAQLRWLSEHLPGGKGQESQALDADGACALALGALRRAQGGQAGEQEAARRVLRQVCKAGPAGLELCWDAALAGVLRAALAARAQGFDLGPGMKMVGRSPGWLMALGCDCASAGHGKAACEAFEWLYKAPGGRCAQPKSCYVDEKGCKRRRGPGRIAVASRQGASSWGIGRQRDVFEAASLGPVGDLVLRGDGASAARLARLGVKFQQGKELARAQGQLESSLAKVLGKPGQAQLAMAHGMAQAWGEDPAAVPKGWAARMGALALDLALPAGPVRQAKKPGI